MRIILASKSPRRKEILENIGLNFDIIVSDVDEKSDITDPASLVKNLGLRKGKAVFDSLKDKTNILIISCDTLVVCAGKILGKPHSRSEAKEMLTMLNGNSHSVISGLALIYNGKYLVDCEESIVTFDKLSDAEIESYLDTDEPYDKAGSYAVQGLFSKYIRKIDGCYFNIVGLPVNLLYNMAKKFDIDL